MSLKSSLNQIIKDRHGEYTLKELEDYCHKAGYKLSNAERRLRESPDIEPVYNKKHTAIVAYKARQTQESAITGVCCPSWSIFHTHALNCPQNEHKQITLNFKREAR